MSAPRLIAPLLVAGIALSSAFLPASPAAARSSKSKTIVLTPNKTWAPKSKKVIYTGPRASGRKRTGKVESSVTKVKLSPVSRGAPKDAVKGKPAGKTFGLRASNAAIGHEYTVTVTMQIREWKQVTRQIGTDQYGRPHTQTQFEEQPPRNRDYVYRVIVPLPDLPKVTLPPGETTTVELPDTITKVKVLRANRKRSQVELVEPPNREKAGVFAPPKNLLKITAKKVGSERYVIQYYMGKKKMNANLSVRVAVPKSKKTKKSSKK